MNRRSLSRRTSVRVLAAGLILLHPPLSLGVARGEVPGGGSVVAGAATIAGYGNTLNVTTHTDRSVINWQNFSIGSGATANFHQPGASSAVLNRVVTPNNPSAIYGQLNSNGQVYLVNPSGILIGPGGMVNANGFTASTLDISNKQFMQGEPLTFQGESTASVINQGTIQTGSGGAALLGHQVLNSGTITSQGGSISMASGGSVTLADGSRYIQADMGTLQKGISETAPLINNTGTVRATGAFKSGGEVYLVNPGGKVIQRGLIAAQRQTSQGQMTGGTVRIEATRDVARVEGTVEVKGQTGGQVEVLGQQVKLAGATIDASGTHGGGTVRIGGGLQGNDASLRNATTTVVDADSVISADARESGDAGSVVVWADDDTQFAGQIYARSLGQSGNGGFAEVSGKQTLGFSGMVDTSSITGLAGILLLDPSEYDVNPGGGGSGPNSIGANTLEGLLMSNNVVIATNATSAGTGEIRINPNANVIWNSAHSLTFLAHGNIRANANVQNAGTGSVNLVAGWDGTTGLPLVTGANVGSTFDLATFLSPPDVSRPPRYGNTAYGGDVFINHASNSQSVAVGSARGATNVLANNLIVRGRETGRGYAQLGFRHESGGTVGSTITTGAINAYLTGSLEVQAGTVVSVKSNASSYAQIGHGGWRSSSNAYNYTGDILLSVGQSVTLAGNTGTDTYAQIGHGGRNASGSHSGSIALAAEGAVTLSGGNGSAYTYALLGHGGSFAGGDKSGEITLQLDDALSLNAGSGHAAFAQIGHGGYESSGVLQGAIDLSAVGTVALNGVNSVEAHARIGHDGSSAWNSSYASGNIVVRTDGNAALNQGMIGHNTATAGGYTSGDTYIGVGQGAAKTGTLTANASSAINSAPTGELRFYMPNRASYQIAAGTPLNGTPALLPGTNPLPNEKGNFSIGDGPYHLLADASRNYAFYFNEQILIRMLASGSSIYGTTPGAPTFVLNSGTLVGGDTVYTIGLTTDLALTVTSGSPVAGSPYIFDILGTSLDPKYQLDPTSYGEWTVTPATLNVFATAGQSKVYGNLDPTFAYTHRGLTNGDTAAAVFSGALTRTAGENVGNYAINQGTLAASVNYAVTYDSNLFGITQRALTITANDQFKPQGLTLLFDPTADFTASGLQNSESIGSVTLSSAGVPPAAPAGAYSIQVSAPVGGSFDLNNYDLTLVPGRLLVAPVSGQFLFDQLDRYRDH